MEFLRINDITFKPTNISFSYESLDKSERTMDGTMVVDMIGKKKKVTVDFEYMSKEDMEILSRLIKTNVFLSVAFRDNDIGELVTIIAKVSNLNYAPYYDWSKDSLMWKGVSISFVER